MSHLCCNFLAYYVVELSATEYFVRPTDSNSTSCPFLTCLTVNEITNSSAHYLKSDNTIFTFLSGHHTMKTPLEICNVRNITFRAVNKHDVSL